MLQVTSYVAASITCTSWSSIPCFACVHNYNKGETLWNELCFEIQSLKKKKEITESVTGSRSVYLCLFFKATIEANIIELLGFDWIYICIIELTFAIIELFWASLNCFATSLNCTTAPLNQTAAGIELTPLNCGTTLLNETVVNSSYRWYSYQIQLELYFVSKFNVSMPLEDYRIIQVEGVE